MRLESGHQFIHPCQIPGPESIVCHSPSRFSMMILFAPIELSIIACRFECFQALDTQENDHTISSILTGMGVKWSILNHVTMHNPSLPGRVSFHYSHSPRTLQYLLEMFPGVRHFCSPVEFIAAADSPRIVDPERAERFLVNVTQYCKIMGAVVSPSSRSLKASSFI